MHNLQHNLRSVKNVWCCGRAASRTQATCKSCSQSKEYFNIRDGSSNIIGYHFKIFRYDRSRTWYDVSLQSSSNDWDFQSVKASDGKNLHRHWGIGGKHAQGGADWSSPEVRYFGVCQSANPLFGPLWKFLISRERCFFNLDHWRILCPSDDDDHEQEGDRCLRQTTQTRTSDHGRASCFPSSCASVLVDASQIWKDAEAAAGRDPATLWRMKRVLWWRRKTSREWRGLLETILEEYVRLLRRICSVTLIDK